MKQKRRISRRKFVRRAALGGVGLAGGGLAYTLFRDPAGPGYPTPRPERLSRIPGFQGKPPNLVLINADDLGYGDLSCYGSSVIRTPAIDGLARDGMRFTDFHACDAVCTPSRAGLLTGRYPVRMMLDTPLQPGHLPLRRRLLIRAGYLAGRMGLIDLPTRGAVRGLHEGELTLAEGLKSGGYRTGMVGKWHLGDFSHDARYNPIRHGFDHFFGVPYSNDMQPLPLFRNGDLLEDDVEDQGRLTGLYTEEAEDFIRGAGDRPFFLYIAHTFPHRPLRASRDFAGASDAGLYGDVVQEVDWSVERILGVLEERGLAENTWVFFTSDNGPWYQGSPGAFRGRKGQTFEGGHRVPFIARAPGRIPPGSVCEVPAINLDLFPTCLAAAGLALPRDRIIDGRDLRDLLTGASESPPHDFLYLYHQGELEGVRGGDWKYLRDTSHYTWPMPNNKRLGFLTDHTTGPLPLLHNLRSDPGEAYNLAGRHPEVVEWLEGALVEWEATLEANLLGFRG